MRIMVVVDRPRERVNWEVVVELSRLVEAARGPVVRPPGGGGAEIRRALSAREIVTLMQARIVELRNEGVQE